jgi:hypothetical protein
LGIGADGVFVASNGLSRPNPRERFHEHETIFIIEGCKLTNFPDRRAALFAMIPTPMWLSAGTTALTAAA